MAIKIVQGEDITLTVTLTDKDTGNPFSLSGLTGASAFFAAASGGSVATLGSLLSADRGQVTFPLSETFTAAMQTGTELDMEIAVDQGAQRTIAQILGQIEVDARLFT